MNQSTSSGSPQGRRSSLFRVGVAAVIGAAGVSLAVWQIWSSASPTTVAAANRRDIPESRPGGSPRIAPGAGPAEPGAAADEGPSGIVLNLPDPQADGGMRRVEAKSVEDAARQLGITADELRQRLADSHGPGGGGGPVRRVVRGPGGVEQEITPNPFKGVAGLTFETPDAKTAAEARGVLKRAIEAQLAGIVDWGSAPVRTGEAIADAAATAIIERLRGGEAWANAVESLGGNRSGIPTGKPAEGSAGAGAGAMLLTLFEGAGVDAGRVSARKGASSTEGLTPPAPKTGEGPPRRSIAITREAGPNGEGELAVRMPTGEEFAAVQGFAGDALPEVEIQVPVNLAQIEAPPGAARLSVIMAPAKADGPWQPAAFILRIDNGPAADAFMKSLRPRK